MQTVLKGLACVAALVVVGAVGQSCGWFKVPAFETAGRYGSSAVAWARGGFKGSPLAGIHGAEPEAPSASRAAKAKAELAHLIGESKRRAIAKYPDLAVANTEINSRFVFRYNYLVKEGNPRLQEPGWPEDLADECAAAAQVHARSGKEKLPAKGTTGLNSPKKMVATSVP